MEDATVERREAACLAKARGTFYEVPDQDVAPIGAPLPHVCEGKGNDGGSHADQIMGAMTHVRLPPERDAAMRAP